MIWMSKNALISYHNRNFDENPLEIFYVGGLGNQYQIVELAKAVSGTRNCHLTLCCREQEWANEKAAFLPYLSEKITVIHENGSELESYSQQADICSLLFPKSMYIDFAVSFKTFESLAHEAPMIAKAGTTIGNFIAENQIGWSIEYTADSIRNPLAFLIDHPDEIEARAGKCREVKRSNLWSTRAQQVADDLIRGAQRSDR